MAADKEIMRAIETLRLDRPGRTYGMARQVLDVGEHLGNQLIGALSSLAATYRDEAELWSRSGAKGWKSAEAEAYLIAQAIDDVVAKLDNAGGGAALSVSEPREPFVPTEAATTPERLDAFVNQAVAEGRGLLKPITDQADVTFTDGPVDPAPPRLEIGGEDVTAYLKGDTNTLPGLTEALVPSSVHDVTAEPLTAESVVAVYDTLPETMITPSTWESDTLTADGHRPPGAATAAAPPLGQPGDMGTGYSHDYVPAGGRKLTFADLLTVVPVASLPPHLSHGQGNTIGDCAAKYRMQRIENLPQIPQWANIGGTAAHACFESIERMVVANPALSLDGIDVETVWKHHFEQTISAELAKTKVPISVWRSARKGAEGEQWWRVNGPLMLRRYLDARPTDPTMTTNDVPAIELDLTVDVQTPYGPIPFNGKLDRVTVGHAPGHPEQGVLIIRDYKTSYERPTDTTQLGDYAWVLALAWSDLMAAGVKILGSYFDARRGTWTEPVDLLQAHPFEAFQYNVTSRHAQKRALTTGPTPARKSDYCGGCAVRYACPIMASKT